MCVRECLLWFRLLDCDVSKGQARATPGIEVRDEGEVIQGRIENRQKGWRLINDFIQIWKARHVTVHVTQSRPFKGL